MVLMVRRIFLVFTLIFTQISGQKVISDAVNSFALKLLLATSNEAGDSLNLALSPYTVWTVLSVIAEGANNNTAKQLETVLNLPANKSEFRTELKNASGGLLRPAPGVNLDISNAIFTTVQQDLKPTFQQNAETFYDVTVRPTNFKDTFASANSINSFIEKATRNRIKNFVTPADLTDAQIFVTSALYFKGTWKLPFNKSQTKKEPFFNEKETIIGYVDMMNQSGPFGYARLEVVQAHALELPYGDVITGNKMSMIVILPFKSQSLLDVLTKLAKTPFSTIIDQINKAKSYFYGADVYAFIPKFKINSDLNMNVVLDKMGITDLFSEANAELLGIFPHYLYVSRFIQKAEIEVNEEGTVASSAAGAALVDKTIPPKFLANRPFLYFIVDNPSGTIVFSGRIVNPQQLSPTS